MIYLKKNLYYKNIFKMYKYFFNNLFSSIKNIRISYASTNKLKEFMHHHSLIKLIWYIIYSQLFIAKN